MGTAHAGLEDSVVKAIEEFVNSDDLERFVDRYGPWDEVWDFIRHRIPPLTPDQEARLRRDLRDWWKNGNMYHQVPGAEWALGEPDFWA